MNNVGNLRGHDIIIWILLGSLVRNSSCMHVWEPRRVVLFPTDVIVLSQCQQRYLSKFSEKKWAFDGRGSDCCLWTEVPKTLVGSIGHRNPCGNLVILDYVERVNDANPVDHWGGKSARGSRDRTARWVCIEISEKILQIIFVLEHFLIIAYSFLNYD